MTTYYIENNGAIVLSDEDKERLINTLDFMPDYKELEIKETENLIVDGEILTKEEYDLIQDEKEALKIANLSLTAADVERAIYKVKGYDFDDIVSLVENSSTDIDIKALKIELKANNFYRGNEYIDQIGTLLGFTSEQLDNFFETGSYEELS